MEIRDLQTEDLARVREVTESSMTSSFSLSPQQIDSLVETEFGDDRLTDAIDDANTVALVAALQTNGDNSQTVVGFFLGTTSDDRGHVQWLFVDPEHRGRDVGTNLFETGAERLREAGASNIRVYALQAGMDGHQFFEQFGYEQIEEQRVDIGSETLGQFVYAPANPETTDQTVSNSDSA